MEGLRYCRGGDFTVNVETRPHIAAETYRKKSTRQVHLVNYWPGHPVRFVPVIIEEKGLSPAKATLYSPEHEATSLDLGRYGPGWIAVVPVVDTYSVVVFE